MLKLVFRFVQLPPGKVRLIVVLVMIAKEVTGYKSPQMILTLCTGFMRILFRMLSAMRQIRTKVKKLKGRHNGRQHPEKDYILQRKEKFQHVKRDGHQQDLPPGNVLLQKAEIPGPE